MSKTRWITRDGGCPHSDYEIWARKPRLDGDGDWISDYWLERSCQRDFEFATGIRLKPGEIAKIRFEKIEVKK